MRLFGLVTAAILFGTLPYFTRILSAEGLAPSAVACARFALTALVLVPWLKWRPATAWALAAGAAVGLGWIAYVRALDELSVALVGVIFMTFPLFAIAIARLGFGEPLGARGLAAAALVLAAAAVAAPWAGMPRTTVLAAALALFAPLSYAFLINVVSRKTVTLPPLSVVGAVALGAVLALSPVVATLPPDEILPETWFGWQMLALFSFGTALLPQLLIVTLSPTAGPTQTAVAGGAELPTNFMVGWVAFGETLSFGHLAAAALIVTALVIAPPPASRTLTPAPTLRPAAERPAEP